MITKIPHHFLMIICVFVIGLFSSLPVLADYDLTQQQICEGNGINYQEAVQFAKQIKVAIEKNDEEMLADMMRYPLRVYTRKQVGERITWNGKKKIKWPIVKHGVFIVHSNRQFIKDYYRIIIPELSARVKKNPSNIFCNYRGGMAYSALWFEGFLHKPLKLFEINQPMTH